MNRYPIRCGVSAGLEVNPLARAESIRSDAATPPSHRCDADLIESLSLDLDETLRALATVRRDLEAAIAAEQRLLAWQQNAFQTVKGWARVGELVPGSFRLPGARLSDCTHAYIDHLRAENTALVRANHSMRGEVTDGEVTD